MKIVPSKQEEEFKATTIEINILNPVLTKSNPKVLIQGVVWSFEVLITNV